jgi:epoxyqueuosine reductase
MKKLRLFLVCNPRTLVTAMMSDFCFLEDAGISARSTLFPEEKVIVVLREEDRMERAQNFQRAKAFFSEELAKIGYYGIIGAASFNKVYHGLSLVQKDRLKDLCDRHFEHLRKNGSIICIGMAYPEHAIDCIDVKSSNGTIDRDAWNVYAREYHRLNGFLNNISRDLAELFDGFFVPATVEGIVVESVEDYYEKTVSHRVIAEDAGLGWRGKNELIVNERFGCAVRFASVIVNLPLIHGRKVKLECGECEACLDACPILRNKDKLKNYRENCRKYIAQLGLEGKVCGKCIKACCRQGIYSNGFKLRSNS